MAQYDPEFFGTQIQGEMENLGINTVKELQQRLEREEPDERGTSYSAVIQYVNGAWPSEPRRAITQALGRIFRVRPDYLLFGGPRTEREAELEAEVEAEARARAPVWDEVRQRIPELEPLPYRFSVALLDHAGQRASLESSRRRKATGEPPPIRSTSDQREEVLAFVEEAWEELSRPLAQCPTLTDYAVFDYLDAALHAKNLALRLPTEEKWRRTRQWAESIRPIDPPVKEEDNGKP